LWHGAWGLVVTVSRRQPGESAGFVISTRSTDYLILWAVQTQAVLTGARRIRKERPRKKAALRIESLRAICGLLLARGDALSLRNRAVLVIGFACGFRKSNINRLLVTEVRFCEKGLIVHESSSKVDQEGRGRDIPVFRGIHPETCPVQATQDWLAVRGEWQWPLFVAWKNRSKTPTRRAMGKGLVPRIVKYGVRDIGLDPRAYSAHSLRIGMVTEAKAGGADDTEVMRITGHTNVKTMAGYIQPDDIFPANDPFRSRL
jgi:site-specific recombinase XerD